MNFFFQIVIFNMKILQVLILVVNDRFLNGPNFALSSKIKSSIVGWFVTFFDSKIPLTILIWLALKDFFGRSLKLYWEILDLSPCCSVVWSIAFCWYEKIFPISELFSDSIPDSVFNFSSKVSSSFDIPSAWRSSELSSAACAESWSASLPFYISISFKAVWLPVLYEVLRMHLRASFKNLSGWISIHNRSSRLICHNSEKSTVLSDWFLMFCRRNENLSLLQAKIL